MIKEDGNWLGLCGEKAIPNINESGADIFRNAIKTMYAAYIGFHGSLREWLRDNPDLTGELLNLSGYWYFPESLEITEIKKSSLSFIIKWFNKGVAPAYSEYALKIKLSNKTNAFESMEFEIENPVIEI